MEDQVNRLVDKAWAGFLKTPTNKRYMIAIAGIPGSGKTTLSRFITTRLNALYLATQPSTPAPPPIQPNEIAAFVPMDGYHYTRAHLLSMPNPDEAVARRGAAFTFDAPAFHALALALSQPLTSETSTIYAPSFDHAIKDPVHNDIPILPTHRIVVFEGNYLALDTPPWSDAAKLMDELWFVDVDFEVARRRLVKRHVEAGIAKDEAEADKRAMENDLVNGREIVEGRLQVDEVVVSREDDAWRHE